jgi:hypothetical protein
MYPVITRAYETGSDQDTLETGSANLVIGVGAGVIAVAVLALGLVALSQQGGAGEGCAFLCWVLRAAPCQRLLLVEGRGGRLGLRRAPISSRPGGEGGCSVSVVTHWRQA